MSPLEKYLVDIKPSATGGFDWGIYVRQDEQDGRRPPGWYVAYYPGDWGRRAEGSARTYNRALNKALDALLLLVRVELRRDAIEQYETPATVTLRWDGEAGSDPGKAA